MSSFSDRVKPKVTDNKPPRVSAKTEYTDADLNEGGKPVIVETLCDEASTVCLIACNYAVRVYSNPVAENGKTYITSNSVDPTSAKPPPKPPINKI